MAGACRFLRYREVEEVEVKLNGNVRGARGAGHAKSTALKYFRFPSKRAPSPASVAIIQA